MFAPPLFCSKKRGNAKRNSNKHWNELALFFYCKNIVKNDLTALFCFFTSVGKNSSLFIIETLVALCV